MGQTTENQNGLQAGKQLRIILQLLLWQRALGKKLKVQMTLNHKLILVRFWCPWLKGEVYLICSVKRKPLQNRPGSDIKLPAAEQGQLLFIH